MAVPKGQYKYEFYEPDAALYRNFADLPLDDAEAYARFANQYGFLSLGRLNLHYREGEPIQYWREQVFRVKGVVELHELSFDRRKLARVAQPSLSNNRFSVRVPFDQTKCWTVGGAAIEDIRTNADRVRYVIAQEVENAFRKSAINLKPIWHQEETRFVMRPNPRNLLGLIWYQVAESMAGDAMAGLTKCEICELWFEARRNTRKTCSEKCKKARQRRNQK